MLQRFGCPPENPDLIVIEGALTRRRRAGMPDADTGIDGNLATLLQPSKKTTQCREHLAAACRRRAGVGLLKAGNAVLGSVVNHRNDVVGIDLRHSVFDADVSTSEPLAISGSTSAGSLPGAHRNPSSLASSRHRLGLVPHLVRWVWDEELALDASEGAGGRVRCGGALP